MAKVLAPGVVEKDKDEQLDYTFDWSTWLADGDAIASSAWVADPGVDIVNQSIAGTEATVFLSGGQQTTWYAITNTVISTSFPPRIGQRVLKVFVKADETAQDQMGTALFPNKFSAVASLRADRLMVAAAGALPSVKVSDDYIWSKLIAAEAETSRDLRVYFQPTNIIPDDAPQSEVDAMIASGQPWAQEAAYDYDSSFFRGEHWGYIRAKQKPIISVSSLRFVYPSPTTQVFEIPKDWIRLDKKYAHIRLVPTGVGAIGPMAIYPMQMMYGGSGVPFMVQLRYQAGLTNAAANWPDLVDLVQKRAVLSILTDSYLPQSGSISADGLSQTLSVDMSKYYDLIDIKMNGPKGANGGLMTAIHGIRMDVMGSCA